MTSTAKKKVKHGWDSGCFEYHCSCGIHDSFWKTVTNSPQWSAWYKEQSKRFHEFAKTLDKTIGVFDIDECQECGMISQAHFQKFLKFVIKNKLI
jgi:hypothetical protein